MCSVTTGRQGRSCRPTPAGLPLSGRDALFQHMTRSLAVAVLVVVLSACAASGPATDAQDAHYVPGTGYHMVMAEIAAQRSEYAIAVEEYLHAAERSPDPELSQRATAFAFEFGYDAAALRAARRWAQLAPDDASAHLYVTRLLIRRNDVAGALVAAGKALGDPAQRRADDYLLLADELAQEDNARAVTQLLTRLSATAPASPQLDLAIARAAYGSGDFDLALESAYAVLAGENAADLAADASLLVVRALMGQGEEAAAFEHMARLLESAPSLAFELENARLLAAARRHEEALREIDLLQERVGPQPAIRRLRALVSFDAGDGPTAWAECGELLREGEFVDECLFYLGVIAEQQGQPQQAVELYSRVPDGAYRLPAELALLRIVEAHDGADAALRQIEEFAGSYPRLGFETDRLRAGVLQRAGRYEEARVLLDQALTFRPYDRELLLARGTLLEQMGKLEPAIADMSAAVAIAPDDAVALNALGYTLANKTRRIDEAYRLIRRAIEREPDNAAILDSYGWVHYRLGRLAEARSYLQLAYSRFPDPEVAAHLGEVLWQQGDRAKARAIWQEALERAPDNAPLIETMARFPD